MSGGPQRTGDLRQYEGELLRLDVLEDVDGDDGVVRAAEVVVDRVEPVDLVAAGTLLIDEGLGDVGAAYGQPGLLELVGVPARAGADLENVTAGDRLGQTCECSGHDPAAGRLAGIVVGDQLVRLDRPRIVRRLHEPSLGTISAVE